MPINLRKDRNRPRSPLAIPTAPSRDQSPPIDELFTGHQPPVVLLLLRANFIHVKTRQEFRSSLDRDSKSFWQPVPWQLAMSSGGCRAHLIGNFLEEVVAKNRKTEYAAPLMPLEA